MTDVAQHDEFETCTYCKRDYPKPVSLHHDEAECEQAIREDNP